LKVRFQFHPLVLLGFVRLLVACGSLKAAAFRIPFRQSRRRVPAPVRRVAHRTVFGDIRRDRDLIRGVERGIRRVPVPPKKRTKDKQTLAAHTAVPDRKSTDSGVTTHACDD
jgi:hypothetical protein